jgi:hypothetical protein
MAGSNAELKQIIRDLGREGYVVSRTKSGHYSVCARDGRRLYALPSTPGRGRGMNNLRAALKRKGLLNGASQR